MNTAKTVVVKLGSEVVSDNTSGAQHKAILQVAYQVSNLLEQGTWPVIVTSGSINTGRAVLHTPTDSDETPRLQALAAIGQPILMNAFIDALKSVNVTAAQVLITQANFDRPIDSKHIVDTLDYLRNNKIVPIINENDTVATEEFNTDNDQIAGQLAVMTNAEELYLVTGKVNGFLNQNNQVVPTIRLDQQEGHRVHVKNDSSLFGRGGMASKYAVACKSARAGIETYILGASELSKISTPAKPGTHFSTK